MIRFNNFLTKKFVNNFINKNSLKFDFIYNPVIGKLYNINIINTFITSISSNKHIMYMYRYI